MFKIKQKGSRDNTQGQRGTNHDYIFQTLTYRKWVMVAFFFYCPRKYVFSDDSHTVGVNRTQYEIPPSTFSPK